MKKCLGCGEGKRLDMFPTKSNGRPRPRCKSCRAEYMREYYRRPDVQEKHKARARNNPNRPMSSKRTRAKLYGFKTVEELEDFIRKNSGPCPICKTAEAEYIDHSHETGKVRGYICRHYNFALGHARDSPGILRSAARYLDESK